MPARSSALLAQRTRQIISKLKKTYPDAHCELNHSSPLQLLIATILSAQCTDERVNKVTPALFARCRTARDFAEISTAELEGLIRTTGFFRSKAKSIRGCAAALLKDHGGEVPTTMEQLHKLPGVGRKTANVVLGNAFNLAEGVVVDTSFPISSSGTVVGAVPPASPTAPTVKSPIYAPSVGSSSNFTVPADVGRPLRPPNLKFSLHASVGLTTLVSRW